MAEVTPLQHDTASATALALADIIVGVLRPEEVGLCLQEFYEVILACLLTYEEQRPAITSGQPSNN